MTEKEKRDETKANEQETKSADVPPRESSEKEEHASPADARRAALVELIRTGQVHALYEGVIREHWTQEDIVDAFETEYGEKL